MLLFLVAFYGAIWTIRFIQIGYELEYIRKKMK